MNRICVCTNICTKRIRNVGMHNTISRLQYNVNTIRSRCRMVDAMISISIAFWFLFMHTHIYGGTSNYIGGIPPRQRLSATRRILLENIPEIIVLRTPNLYWEWLGVTATQLSLQDGREIKCAWISFINALVNHLTGLKSVDQKPDPLQDLPYSQALVYQNWLFFWVPIKVIH